VEKMFLDILRAPKIMRFTTETQEDIEVKSFESANGGFKDFILRDLCDSVVNPNVLRINQNNKNGLRL
jgi:hypothetical protein